MYAVIVTGGKQYRVEKDDVIYVEKLAVEAGETVEFDQVLAVGEDGNVKFGTPTVAGALVKGNVEKQGKGKKLNILRYRAKKGSMRKMGHRQPFTKITITDIVG
ncbi:MAG: 50S ribosomal protein L21 [Pygmaiobacter sp.]